MYFLPHSTSNPLSNSVPCHVINSAPRVLLCSLSSLPNFQVFLCETSSLLQAQWQPPLCFRSILSSCLSICPFDYRLRNHQVIQNRYHPIMANQDSKGEEILWKESHSLKLKDLYGTWTKEDEIRVAMWSSIIAAQFLLSPHSQSLIQCFLCTCFFPFKKKKDLFIWGEIFREKEIQR